MVRLLHRAAIVSGVILISICGASPVKAQAGLGAGGILSDPFTFYYGVYLPNQQLQSLRSSPNDTINSAMVTRQYYNQTNRSGLYDPISPYADDSSDPLRPFAKQGGERLARVNRFASTPNSSDGSGPSVYYGRASQYFPGLNGRSASNRNANVATGKAAGRSRGGVGGGGMGGGMGGMGGMGGGMGMY